MRTLRFASAACVLAVAAFLVGDQAFSGDKGKDTAEWTVIVKSAKVKNTKADGAAWDPMDGAPDLFVRVRVDDKSAKDFDTKVVKEDAFEADFNTDTNVRFRIGQKVILTVIDKDVAANDDCGTYNLITTEPVISKGKLRLENFGQVVYLDLEFKKL